MTQDEEAFLALENFSRRLDYHGVSKIPQGAGGHFVQPGEEASLALESF